MAPKDVPTRSKSSKEVTFSPSQPNTNPKKRKALSDVDSSSHGARPPPQKPRFPPRVAGARDIAAQSESAALSADGELDLQAFLRAREFEIGALTESMALSRSVGKSRAFQQVPRGMRRRTASHNFKRVPRRLRARAEREMWDDNTPRVTARRRKPVGSRGRIRAETAKKLGILAKRKREKKERRGAKNTEKHVEGAGGEKAGTTSTSKLVVAVKSASTTPSAKSPVVSRAARPKIRQNLVNDPPRPDSKFRKRQIDKTWLPTHTWHAKRARMTDPSAPLWRFAVPLTPNDKVYRPTHRAQAQRGAVVWDTSCMSTIAVYGTVSGMERVLRRVGVEDDCCWGWTKASARWKQGMRSWTGILSREGGQSGRRDICPATIVWCPLENPATSEFTMSKKTTEFTTSKKAKSELSRARNKKERRQVLIRVHPAAFLEVFNELVRWTKMETPRMHVEDLRWELGSIELTGPAAMECLHAILRPWEPSGSPKEPHAAVFESLAGLTNPASTPAGALLAFSIQDPRLHYPPRRVIPTTTPDEDYFQLCNTLAHWPADDHTSPYGVCDRHARFTASRLPSQKSINRRRGATLPGHPIAPSVGVDPPIPILLLASRSPSSTSSSSRSALTIAGSWTLVAPWKAIQPLWYGLVHVPLSSGGVPRFGGLDEMRQVAFERKALCFPFDYPATDAGAAWEVEMRARRQREWERRPKSKRPNWDSVVLGAGRHGEVGLPWGCAWEEAFKGTSLPVNNNNNNNNNSNNNNNDDDDDDDAMDVDPSAPAPFTLSSLVALSSRAFSSLIRSSSSLVPPYAIITVRLTFPSRGVALPCARIYRLPAPSAAVPPATDAEVPASNPSLALPCDLRDQWLAQLPLSHPSRPSHLPATTRPNPTPHPNDILGRVRDPLAQKRALVAALVTTASLSSSNKTTNGTHPAVPDAADLVGFVLAGSYCLADGRASAIGCLVAAKVLPQQRGGNDDGAARVCVVRNVGESVGRVATWRVM